MASTNPVASGNILKKVTEGGYCIGCGACAAKDSAYEIVANEYGLYQARQVSSPAADTDLVCPFASDIDETDIGSELYGKSSLFDERVGFYKQIYAGYVVEGDFRAKGSSGGLTTWALAELLKHRLIDAVIHVGETGQVGELFQYRISESVEELQRNAKSRYYPVHMADVLRRIKETNKTYAIVGVPCFIKAVRLLARRDPQIATRIVFCIALFCGHFKSKAFAEMIAWQQGVKPTELTGIDFRVKDSTRPASKYSVEVQCIRNVSIRTLNPISISALYGMDWGLGYFKPEACDWCDDVAGETADLACGDAWLPEYVHDHKGTNIAIVRNATISALIDQAVRDGRLKLDTITPEKIHESQSPNYRHRREGLAARISRARQQHRWHPRKRVDPDQLQITARVKEVSLVRSRVAHRSHIKFRDAKQRGCFYVFPLSMFFSELRYYLANGRFVRRSLFATRQLLRLLVRKV